MWLLRDLVHHVLSFRASVCAPSPLPTCESQDEGNTLLADNYLEQLTLLRMNKAFMKFMSEYYNDVAEQAFKR